MSLFHRPVLGFPPEPSSVHCERIIALHGGGMPRGWWQAIRVDSRPLFGPSSRFDEAPIDNCWPAVESALAQGFRPVLFVPVAAEWPAVYQQLGPAATIVRICVLGRHDDAMRHLLHEPSAELVHAAASGARLLVPDPEYGKAMDAVLRTALSDFVAAESQSAALPERRRQTFHFISRLNPYRHLILILDHENAVAQLRQEYRAGDPSSAAEPCDACVRLADAELRFADGLSAVSAASMAAVSAGLRLPRSDQALWALVAELIKASTGRLFATVSEQSQAAVAELGRSKEALARISTWLFAGSPAQFAPELRTRGGRDAYVGGAGPAVAMFVSRIDQTKRGLMLRLVWIPGGRPAELPSTYVEINAGAPIRLDSTGADWAADGSALTLLGMKCIRLQLAWRWDRPKAELRLRLRGEIELPLRRG